MQRCIAIADVFQETQPAVPVEAVADAKQRVDLILCRASLAHGSTGDAKPIPVIESGIPHTTE